MVPLNEIVSYLDEYLSTALVPDAADALNGLQLEGAGTVRRIATAVDCCAATITRAVEQNADLVIVHHGLFWGSKAPITGAYQRRLAALIKNGISVYSSHAPLDVHPEVGNNRLLADLLGVRADGLFAFRDGVGYGVQGKLDIDRAALVERIRQSLGVEPFVVAAGPDRVRRIGIITGAAGRWADRAVEAGLDTFVTGEGPHDSYFLAEEQGINMIFAGHYATETLGVRRLGEQLADRLGVEAFFIDHPTGL